MTNGLSIGTRLQRRRPSGVLTAYRQRTGLNDPAAALESLGITGTLCGAMMPEPRRRPVRYCSRPTRQPCRDALVGVSRGMAWACHRPARERHWSQ